MQRNLRYALAIISVAAAITAANAQGGDPTIPDPQPWVRLGISSLDATMVDETTVHFGFGVPGDDPLDIAKPDDLASMPLYIATLSEMGVPLALNAYGPYSQEVVLSVQLRAEVADLYTISVLDLGMLAGVTCITLEDLETGNIVALQAGLEIDVEVPAGEPLGARYKLRAFLPTTISLEHVLCPHGSNGAATVVPTGYGPWNITWLNYEDLVIAQQLGENEPVTQGGLYPGAWTVVVESLDGCGTQSFPIFLEVPQELSIAAESQSTTCAESSNGSIALQAAGGVVPYTYEWSNGSTVQNLQNVPAGTYSVTVQDANGCSSTFNGLSVSAPEPIAGSILAPASIGRFEPVAFSSNAAAGVLRTWSFGDGSGSLVPEPLHAYQHLGIFTVRLTLSEGSCNTTVEQDILVQSTVGVGELDTDEVRAWSAGGLITINNPLHVDLHVHIFDATGRITTSTRIPAQTPRLELSTAGWSHGLYFLNASTPWEQWTFSLPVVE